MVAGVLASLAELELELGRERRAAPEARRARGQAIGRPKALDKSKAALARRMHASGEPVSTIAATLGVSRATVYRVLAEQDDDSRATKQTPAQGAKQRKPVQHQTITRTTTMAYIRTHETKQRARGKTVKTYAVVYRAKVRTDDGRVVSRLRRKPTPPRPPPRHALPS